MVRTGATLAALAAAAAVAGGVAAARDPKPISVGYRAQVFVVRDSVGAHRLTGGATEHYAPVWAPHGRSLAVVSRNAIEIIALDGRVRRRFDVPPGVGGIAWGPDGHRLAFGAGRDVVVARIEDGKRRTVAHDAYGAVMWSPDGATIYYGHVPSEGQPTLDAVEPDGGGHRTVAVVPVTSRFLLSPDGKHVLYERGGAGRPALWVLRTRDGVAKELGRVSIYTESFGWFGNDAVFGGKVRGVHPLVISLSGERRSLGVSMNTEIYSVAPDLRRVAWSAQIGGEQQVRSARPDGSRLRVLARFEVKNSFTDVFGLDWSPTGRRLVAIPVRHSGD